VSGFGSYVTTLAVQVLVVVTLHQDSGGVGVVNAAQWLPYLLFGLVAGVLVDRSRRRPMLVTTDLVRGGLLVAVPLLAFTQHLTMVVLAAFMVIFGPMSLVNDAAAQSFLPRLVPTAHLTAAHARLDHSDAVAQTSGPTTSVMSSESNPSGWVSSSSNRSTSPSTRAPAAWGGQPGDRPVVGRDIVATDRRVDGVDDDAGQLRGCSGNAARHATILPGGTAILGGPPRTATCGRSTWAGYVPSQSIEADRARFAA
jgi:Bacterial protein of unknown function (DUF894).